jgi:uncharacterized protein YbjT (DUF2867 family)
VPGRGLEPPRPCERQHLKLVRLPIPPSGHVGKVGAIRGAVVPCQHQSGAAWAIQHVLVNEVVMKDKLVTVFGGGGFVGRYVVQALIKAGARVRIAERHPKRAWFLKGGANLGQVSFVAADVTRPETLGVAVAGADAVVNLVGILKGDFEAVQARGAANVAQAAKAASVATLVHMSAIGADASSPSRYGRTKGEGEAAVLAAMPKAIILRPSIIFGREDGFVNRFAKMISLAPVIPVIRGAVKFQPVFVGDVARGIVSAVADAPRHGGKVFALGGPEVIDMEGINRWIAKAIGRAPLFVEMPDMAAGMMARFTGFLPGAPMSWDQWLMLQTDNVVAPAADGLAALGVTPTPLDAVAPDWLVQYRRHGRFGKKVGVV